MRLFGQRVHRVRWFGLGLGAGVFSYALLDPRRGAARRAMIRDKFFAFGRDLRQESLRVFRRLEWRTRGIAHEVQARMYEGEVSDDLLIERVRAQLGRPVSHPHALEVHAERGKVILSGPILAHEIPGLLARVARVRGVKGIENHLDVRMAQ